MNHAKRFRVDVAALTDPGRVRERNEDAFAVFRIGRFLERVVEHSGGRRTGCISIQTRCGSHA